MSDCLTHLRPRSIVLGCRCERASFSCEACGLRIGRRSAVFEVDQSDTMVVLACANCASAVTADELRRAGVDVRLHRGGLTAGVVSCFGVEADVVVAIHRQHLVQTGVLASDEA